MSNELATKPWFRLYSEFVSDPKIQLLSFDDQRHFVAILCLKCNGTLDTNSVSQDHHERLIARAIGLDLSTAKEAKRRLMEVGLIDDDWEPVRWSSRQYESDSSTARVHKWRAKQSETFRKRSSNGDATFKSRADAEQSRAEQTQNAAAHDWESHRQWVLDELRSVYPSNLYSDADWEMAARTMAGRLTSGETSRADLHRLTLEFASQQDAKGSRNTQFIENPARHFDGRGRWRGPFMLPAATGKPSAEPVRTWRPEHDDTENNHARA